jgi:uncharacterized protein (TIGR03382 family)
LQQQGTASQPITIHAEDPANPPVWDLSATDVASAPGSYGAGDKDRGCWQVIGNYYYLSGLVFTGCHNAGHNSAGLRYYGGAIGLEITDCVFRLNDNGLTGGTQHSQATVEFCEFDRNGNLAAGAPTHNLYIYGGTFALRYSYLHDSVQAQNLHCRAQEATIEYNWIARAASYAGDLMTSDDFLSEAGPYVQSTLLRGNVIVQGNTQANHGQIWALFNDTFLTGLSLSIRAIDNTLVGAGGSATLIHLSNADGTTMSADVSNNIISGTSVPVLVEDAANATVSGTNNWMATGTAPGDLAASIFSVDPGFNDPAANDFTLASGSACIGAASASVPGLPDREYYRDETLTREYRNRLTTADLGAFEHTTTGPGIGPYGSSTDGGPPDAGPSADAGPDGGTDAGAIDAGPVDAGASDAGPHDAGFFTADGGGTIFFVGCNCGSSSPASTSALPLLTLLAVAMRRSRIDPSR